jgi:hypothetical protein
MNKDTRFKIIGYSIIALLIILLLTGLGKVSHDLKVARHNLDVSRDSIEVLELKNGDLVYEMGSYILEKKELEHYLNISKAEVKELEKKLDSKLAYISSLEAQIRYDTLVSKDTSTISGDTVYINIGYKNDWINIDGFTTLHNGWSTTQYNSIKVPAPLRVGLTDNYNIWVESKNPYLVITDIEGAAIQGSSIYTEPKRWSMTIQLGVGGLLGYGLCIPPGGVVSSGVILGGGLYFGLGVSYKLIEF